MIIAITDKTNRKIKIGKLNWKLNIREEIELNKFIVLNGGRWIKRNTPTQHRLYENGDALYSG